MSDPGTVEPTSFLSTAADDGRALLAAPETGWDRLVPHCPEWNAAGLVRHTGGIFEWIAAIIASGDRVSRRNLDPRPRTRPGWPPGISPR
jgi:hypothetical protein